MSDLRQGSPEWLAARRELITATDVPVLLGLSPWKCEADLADEKRGLSEPEPASLRMKIGSALEGLIGAEYTRVTGRQVRRYRGLAIHPSIAWAGASPDFRAKGRLVEAKRSASRTRFADGVPRDIEAQVAWQLGVTGYPRADIAALVGDDELAVFEQRLDRDLFEHLVTIAADFRRRLADGGPFARDMDRIRRDHPRDDGSEVTADAETADAVRVLLETRARRKALEETEEHLEAAIKGRMGDAAYLTGPGWRVSWKKTKDVEQTDWRSLADGLLREMPEPERTALVGIHTSTRAGFRPFRVVLEKEDA